MADRDGQKKEHLNSLTVGERILPMQLLGTDVIVIELSTKINRKYAFLDVINQQVALPTKHNPNPSFPAIR
jgi:hypothetical protein